MKKLFVPLFFAFCVVSFAEPPEQRTDSSCTALFPLEARKGLDEGIAELNRIHAQGFPNFRANFYFEIDKRSGDSQDNFPTNVLMRRLQERGIRFYQPYQRPSESRRSIGSPFVVRIRRAQISDLEEALSSVSLLSSEYMGMPDADRE
jgi:hypothetical protein